MADLHVVGAGPGGSFSAISALKNGHDVLISEEHTSIGEPVHCSGLVSLSGLEQLSDIVDYKKITQNTINKALMHGDSQSFELTYEKEKALVIDRSSFDRLAIEKYLDLGGKIEYGKKINGISDLRSTNIIGADGPISTIARIFSFPKQTNFSANWQGIYEYRCPDVHCVDVFFSPKIAPGFLGWTIPIDEHRAKVGLGVLNGSVLHEHKQRLIEKLGLRGKKPTSEFSALIPMNTRSQSAKTYVSQKTPDKKYSVLLVGDSAGQTKPTTGGGIFFSASCGRIAGQNFENPADYESKWRDRYGSDLMLHSALRTSLNLGGSAGVDIWMNMIKTLKIDSLLMDCGQMDEYSKMLSLKTLQRYISLFVS